MFLLADSSVMMITLGLIGGLALFLLGMNILTESLTAVAGDKMRQLLGKLTGNRFTAAFSGMVVTAVTQSSSVTTVLLVGFVSAGLMNAAQSLGVIIGANIGSTFTAQIIAFKITAYAPLLLAVGVATQMIAKRQNIKRYAGIAMGLGLVFAGMSMMSEATHPLRENPTFVELMKSMANPLWGVLIGAAFTAIIQSSGATTGLIIVLASQGFVTLEAGIALALGANIGTCFTALLASLGKPRAAWQVALMHILFNVIGVVIWLGFIDQLAMLVRAISPSYPELEGMERIAAAAPRQIANAHTAFNVINAILFLAVTGWIVRLVQWILPVRKPEADTGVTPKYISPDVLSVPSVALDYARLELERVAKRVRSMFEQIPDIIGTPDNEQTQEDIERLCNETEQLYGYVVNYLGQLAQGDLAAGQSDRLHGLLSVGNHLQDLAEIMRDDLMQLGQQRRSEGFDPSEETENRFRDLVQHIQSALDRVIASLHTGETEPAAEAVEMKAQIYGEVDELGQYLVQRLAAEEPNRLTHYRAESDIREQLKRCYYLIRRMAKKLAAMDS